MDLVHVLALVSGATLLLVDQVLRRRWWSLYSARMDAAHEAGRYAEVLRLMEHMQAPGRYLLTGLAGSLLLGYGIGGLW